MNQTEGRKPLPPQRVKELERIFALANAGENCSIVAISNMGKSALLRSVYARSLQDRLGATFVYVDCNRMLSRTDQGLYELILRCVLDALRDDAGASQAVRRVSGAYERITNTSAPFQFSLGFNEGITGLIEELNQPIVLMFDEFDEPFQTLDGRVLLNLRALRDRYAHRLTYILATNRSLREIRCEPDVDEFCEMFVRHTYYLPPLSDEDTREYALYLAQQKGATFDDQDIQFIQQKSGGHPGLVEAICEVLGEVTGEPLRSPSQNWIIHRDVSERLRTDSAVQSECAKLWEVLSEEEQGALLTLLSPAEVPPAHALRALEQKHVVRTTPEGKRIFSQLFEEFIRRQRVLRQGIRRSIRVDVDSGEIWVEGKLVPPLTQLEHRLIMLLYGRLGKIVDKYQVVESVWGQEYIDEVDDARIEKLVSRLRQKIEPDPANPRFLITVRGRGYKLADG